MINFIAKILPMKTIEKCSFVDHVTGENIGIYEQINGVKVMAESRLSLFRVAIKNQ